MEYIELKVPTCGTPHFHLHCSRCTNVSGVSLFVIEIVNLLCLMVVPSTRTLPTHQLPRPRECYHHFIHLEKSSFSPTQISRTKSILFIHDVCFHNKPLGTCFVSDILLQRAQTSLNGIHRPIIKRTSDFCFIG